MSTQTATWKALYEFGRTEEILRDLGDMDAITRRVWIRVQALLDTAAENWDEKGIQLVGDTLEHLMMLGSEHAVFAFVERGRITHLNRPIVGSHRGEPLVEKPTTDYFYPPTRVLEAGRFFGKIPKYRENRLPLYSIYAGLAASLLGKASLASRDDQSMRVWGGFLYEAVESITKAEMHWMRAGGGKSPKGGIVTEQAKRELSAIIDDTLANQGGDDFSQSDADYLAVDIVVSHPDLVAQAISVRTGSLEEGVSRLIWERYRQESQGD